MAANSAPAAWDGAWNEGYSHGQLACARELLRQLVIQRFGGVPASLCQPIDWATDVDCLTAVALQVYHAAAPQDLRLAPGPGGATASRPQLAAIALGGPLRDVLADVGWETGYVEGELAVAQRLLRQLLADRFGSLHEADVRRIESVTDVRALRQAVLQAYCIAAPKYLQL